MLDVAAGLQKGSHNESGFNSYHEDMATTWLQFQDSLSNWWEIKKTNDYSPGFPLHLRHHDQPQLQNSIANFHPQLSMNLRFVNWKWFSWETHQRGFPGIGITTPRRWLGILGLPPSFLCTNHLWKKSVRHRRCWTPKLHSVARRSAVSQSGISPSEPGDKCYWLFTIAFPGWLAMARINIKES